MFSFKKVSSILSVQRGAGFILTAMLLPFILAFSGVAIDFGNLYAHHIRLQNACDSAAKAGGASLAEIVNENKNGDYDCDENDWDYVKSVCEKYTNINLPENVHPEVICESKTKGTGENKSHIFRLTIKEDVPYYFLRPLFNMLGYPTYAEISVQAFTMVVPDTGYGNTPPRDWDEIIEKTDDGREIFDNLFVFEKSLTAINNVQNPDNDKITQQKWNVSTYDGNVKATTQSGRQTTLEILRHETLLQDAAFHGGDETTVAKAKEEGLVTEVECDETIDISKYYETNIVPKINEMFAKFQDPGYVPGEWQVPKKFVSAQSGDNYYYSNENGSQNFGSSDINNWINSGVNTVYLNIPNVNFRFDGTIAGSKSDEPLFIIIDGSPNINFGADMTNSRPIFFVSTRGDSRYNKWSGEDDKMWLQSEGNAYFRGALYAPYSSVGVNDNHHGFNGSIIAKKIELKNQGYYTHEKNYLTPGNSNTTTDIIHHHEDGTNNIPQSHKMVTGGANYWDDY